MRFFVGLFLVSLLWTFSGTKAAANNIHGRLKTDVLRAFEQEYADGDCEYRRASGISCLDFEESKESVDQLWSSRGIELQMTEDEKVALVGYTFDGFIFLNRRLHSIGDTITEKDPYETVLVSALERLPDFHGEVTRYDNIRESDLPNWAPGKAIICNSFMSTMRSGGEIVATPGFTAPYTQGHKQVLKITSLHGKDIHAYSGYPKEMEVLLLPGTRLVVDSQSRQADGTLLIVAREVDAQVPRIKQN